MFYIFFIINNKTFDRIKMLCIILSTKSIKIKKTKSILKNHKFSKKINPQKNINIKKKNGEYYICKIYKKIALME